MDEPQFALELRVIEALLFVAPEPLSRSEIEAQIPLAHDFVELMAGLEKTLEGRGVVLSEMGGRFALRTAPDLGGFLTKYRTVPRKLSRAGQETLAIIAYHQPVTRAEVEDIRGVQVSKGTLDVLLETGWIKMRGRRRAPGRPITYGTTEAFLDQFGLSRLDELPGLEELKGAGLLSSTLPPDFDVPRPEEGAALMADEDPLDPADLALGAEADPLKFKEEPDEERDEG